MSRVSRSDKIRFNEITEILTGPFKDYEFLSVSDKVACMMQPDKFPIYKRKLIQTIDVYGMWWMDADQWARFLSAHYGNAHVIKSGQDPDRVLATKKFNKPGSTMWIRETDTHIDIEGLSKVYAWDPVKKKDLGAVWEWLTVSITKDEYKRLDKFFGPREDGCRHDEDKLKINQG